MSRFDGLGLARPLVALVLVLGAMIGLAPESRAQSPDEYVVQPYYIYPKDQPYHPEYERAVSQFTLEVQQWYAARVGMTFRLAPVKVVQAPEDYLTMRCGPNPTAACRNDRLALPQFLGSVIRAVGGLKPRQVTWLFAQGGGGGGNGGRPGAGGTLGGDFVGGVIVGDWALEPISGVREPAAIPCSYADWQCQGNSPRTIPVHELGHAFGLPHSTAYSGSSIMGAGSGEYPHTSLLPHEVMNLRQSPFFAANTFDRDAPWLDLNLYDDLNFAGGRDSVVRWGQTIRLTGRGFRAGDQVEFVDVDHAVRVSPESVTPEAMRVRVPDGLGPGYVRIRRGDLRSPIVPINITPPWPPEVEVNGLPAGWDAAPLGTQFTLPVNDRQSVTVKGNVWTISAGGKILWGEGRDGGIIVYRRHTGNGSVTVRLLRQTGGNRDWANTAVGFRETLEAGSRDLHLSYISGNQLIAAVRAKKDEAHKHPFQLGADGAGYWGRGSDQVPEAGRLIGSGIWIGMERNGDSFGYYWSDDGKIWTQVARAALPFPAEMLVGIEASATKLLRDLSNQTSVLDHVAVSADLLAPRAITAVAYERRGGGVLVTWNPVSVAEGPVTYNVYWINPNGTRRRKLNPAPINGSSFVVEGLTRGTYRFGVSAVLNGVESPVQLPLPMKTVSPG